MRQIKYILFVIIFNNLLLANANLYLDAPNSIKSSQEYKFQITAIGSKVDFGNIDEISNYPTTLISSNKSITTQNGKQQFMYKKKYALTPKADFILPSFALKIDGKIYKTKSKKITIKSPQKTASDKFELTIKSDKSKIYVGEQINYSVIFKYKDDIQIADLEFVSAQFDNFWSKTLNNNTKIYKKDGYNFQELYFLLFAQKSGKLTIKPSKINLTIANKYDENAIFNTPDEQIEIYSNALDFDVKPLPNDVSLIGDFNIKTKIDKTTISKGEALNFQVIISGFGNIDDIPDISLDIPDTTIYTNKAIKDFFVKGGLYGGVFTKSFSILAQDDFIIPSIKFKYFDNKNRISKEINTDKFHIKYAPISSKSSTSSQKAPVLISGKTKQNKTIKKDKNSNQSKSKKTTNINLNNSQKILYFSAGFVIAIIMIILIKLIKNMNSNIPNNTLKDFTKSIKKSNTPHELLTLILPYINLNEELDNIIFILEDMSYTTDNETDISLKEIKKDIIEHCKKIGQIRQTKFNNTGNEDEKDPFYSNSNI
jgi:hypothetical protein